eukprot:820520-Amphidinium_carterae.1
MSSGCPPGVAESAAVNESQVTCQIIARSELNDTSSSSVPTSEWAVDFYIWVADDGSAAALVEERMKSSSAFETALRRNLREVVNDKSAFDGSFGITDFTPAVTVDNAETSELAARLWISYLQGKVQCGEEKPEQDERKIGNATAKATATCFRNTPEAADRPHALELKRDGAYSVSVPGTIFEDAGRDELVVVATLLTGSALDPYQNTLSYTVGAAMSVVLGDKPGMVYAVHHLSSPINISLEQLPAQS